MVVTERFYADVDGSTKSEDAFELNADGDVFMKLPLAKNESSFSMKVIYMNEETDLGMFYTTSLTTADRKSLKANISTEKCVINKEIEVELASHSPLSSYTYFIVCRSRILESKTVSVNNELSNDPESQLYTYRFTFLPSFEYAPRSKIIIYYMNGGKIISTTVCVEMNNDFKNFVELNVDQAVAKPGQTIELNVKSNPNATVGLLGYDRSLSILRSGNDLAQDEIWNELEMFSSHVKHRQFNYMEHPSSKTPSYHNPWEDFAVG